MFPNGVSCGKDVAREPCGLSEREPGEREERAGVGTTGASEVVPVIARSHRPAAVSPFPLQWPVIPARL